jgi:hypothetical protein
MRKKTLIIFATLLCSILVASISFASPLTDYSSGKTAIDLNWLPNLSGEVKNGLNSYNLDGKRSNFDWGITTGLGNKFALQYRQFNPAANDNVLPGSTIIHGVNTRELNVLYKFDKGLSAFVGLHQAKVTANIPVTADTKNTLQAGLTGTKEIAPKTNIYGVFSFGKNLFSGETGVSYEFAKATELNLFYRYKTVDDLRVNSAVVDTTFKGFGFGLSHKF